MISEAFARRVDGLPFEAGQYVRLWFGSLPPRDAAVEDEDDEGTLR